MSKASDDVLAERARQISAEGWTPEHDDEHQNRELARAAECYVRHYREREWVVDVYRDGAARYSDEPSSDDWPWAEDWWKPSVPRRDLVKAAALLIAEIERLDRKSSEDSHHEIP